NAWLGERGDIAATYEDVFARIALEKRIPAASYQTERARNLMLDDLRKFAADDQWPRGEYASHTEQEFEFDLAEGVTIRGKIDRLDVARDGRAVVIDYK